MKMTMSANAFKISTSLIIAIQGLHDKAQAGYAIWVRFT